MLKRVHLLAGLIAFATILTFWTSTALVELFGSDRAVAIVKLAIPWGFIILIPALAATGISGFRLAGRSPAPWIARKKRRMPFIAANGLLILIPAALYLATLAAKGDFGDRFVVVQAIELLAGAVNLSLMGLNIRDGARRGGTRVAAIP